MIETVRRDLVERGLERGCRFIVAANLLDNMRVHLLFNRLCRHPQRILDRKRRARTMRNNADAVDAEKRTAAVLFVICLVLNSSNGILRKKCAGFSHRCAHELMLEPLKHRHRDRFARFQDHIADKTVAHYDLDWIFEKMAALDVADKVERALL